MGVETPSSSRRARWSVGALLAGSANNGAHAANGLAAHRRHGQDAANVAESQAGITYTQLLDNGDYYWSITLPSLIVATYGGGTGLATQRECLELLGCYGSGKADKLAEICAGVVLAGEISLASAVIHGDWVAPRPTGPQPALSTHFAVAVLPSAGPAGVGCSASTLRPGSHFLPARYPLRPKLTLSSKCRRLVRRRGSTGHVDFVSPLPSPFNYGSVPTTSDSRAICLMLSCWDRGPQVGTRLRVRAWGAVILTDRGITDDELVGIDFPLSGAQKQDVSVLRLLCKGSRVAEYSARSAGRNACDGSLEASQALIRAHLRMRLARTVRTVLILEPKRAARDRLAPRAALA